jgi:hypothetical protein
MQLWTCLFLESYINSTDPLPASNMVHSVIRNLIRNENITKKRYGLLANLSVITTPTSLCSYSLMLLA